MTPQSAAAGAVRTGHACRPPTHPTYLKRTDMRTSLVRTHHAPIVLAYRGTAGCLTAASRATNPNPDPDPNPNPNPKQAAGPLPQERLRRRAADPHRLRAEGKGRVRVRARVRSTSSSCRRCARAPCLPPYAYSVYAYSFCMLSVVCSGCGLQSHGSRRTARQSQGSECTAPRLPNVASRCG